MSIKGNLLSDGFAWVEISAIETQAIEASCSVILAESTRKFGVRNVLSLSVDLRELVEKSIMPIVHKYLHSDAFVVRSTLFDKPLDANWAVPWHQDVTIEVEERYDIPGFGPWSVKEDLLSVQPPQDILEKMLTLRLHLDETDEENGALLVEPGSHVRGKLRIDEIGAEAPVSCNCREGDILMMKPLLFHSSNRSRTAKPRRVLHLDFAYVPLQEPLKWRAI